MGNLKAAALVAALLSGTQRRLTAALVLAAVLFTAVLAPALPVQAAAPVVSADSEQHQQQQTVVVQEQQTQNRNQVIADLQIQITALQEEIRLLNGKLEEQDYKISQMLERQRELYRDIDRRLSGGAAATSEPGSINTVPSGTEPAVDPAAAAAAAAVVTEPAKPAAKPTGKPSAKEVEAEQKAYDAIFPLVRNKQYSEAVKGYSAFLAKYPAGRNAANARYWLGQVYFVQGSNEDAEIQFKQVMSDHADSPKAPDALLKLANIEERRDAIPAAKSLYKQVVQKYPDSSSAAAAQKRLQELR